MSSKRADILIFEAEAKSALPVAESFARRGYRVVAASSRRYCAAFYSRAVRERILMPNEVHEPEACQAFLLDLCRRRRFEMIVPLGDIVTELVCRKRDDFLACGKMVLVPYETFRLGRDKVETLQAAESCGIPMPRTWYPETQPIRQIADEVDYPVLVKPAVANGARGITFVYDKEELIEKYAQVSEAFGRTFVQEFVPHDGLQYKVDLILDERGVLLAGVVYSKIRYYPPSGGSSVLNESVHRPDILAYATKIAQSMNWYGLCDFDFIQDVRDNQPKIMEINPRFPESFRMCEAAGVDFPEILHRMASGESMEPVRDYHAGRYLRFLPGDMLWFMTVGRKRWLSRPSFFDFFNPRTTYQICSTRDVGPIVGYLVENLRVALDPREREHRFRLRTSKRSES